MEYDNEIYPVERHCGCCGFCWAGYGASDVWYYGNANDGMFKHEVPVGALLVMSGQELRTGTVACLRCGGAAEVDGMEVVICGVCQWRYKVRDGTMRYLFDGSIELHRSPDGALFVGQEAEL